MIANFSNNRRILSSEVFDLYPNNAFIFSLRKVNEYTGKRIRVVKTNASNANLGERDFTVDEIIDGTLQSFVGLGFRGVIKEYYEPKENGKTYRQTNISNCPEVLKTDNTFYLTDGVVSASLTTIQWLAALNETNNILNIKTCLVRAQLYAIATVNYAAYGNISGVESGLFLGGTFSTIDGIGAFRINHIPFIVNSGVENTNLNTSFIVNNGINNEVYVNDSLEDTSDNFDLSFNNIGRSESGLSTNGIIKEMVFYTTDETANRVTLQNTINS